MLHFEVLLVSLFTVAVVIVAFYRCCVHRRNLTKSGKSRPANVNAYVIIAMTLAFILQVIANGLYFLWDMIAGKSAFPFALLAAVVTPVSIMAYSVTVIVRKVNAVRLGNRNFTSQRNLTTHTVTAYSSTTYFEFPVDNWYS